jgi:hypothetical protein
VQREVDRLGPLGRVERGGDVGGRPRRDAADERAVEGIADVDRLVSADPLAADEHRRAGGDAVLELHGWPESYAGRDAFPIVESVARSLPSAGSLAIARDDGVLACRVRGPSLSLGMTAVGITACAIP